MSTIIPEVVLPRNSFAIPTVLPEDQKPVRWFKVTGDICRVRPPGHLESQSVKLRLEVVPRLEMALTAFKSTCRISLTKHLQRSFSDWKMDDYTAKDLIRWLVWHGFLAETELKLWDLPELTQEPPRDIHPLDHPDVILDPEERLEMMLAMAQAQPEIPVAYLGEMNGWRAEMTWDGNQSWLCLESTIKAYKLKVEVVKGDTRKRYASIRSREFWAEAKGKLPKWAKDKIKPLVYIAEGSGDGHLYVHRLLSVLWFEVCLNPLGKVTGNTPHLQVHHLNRDSLENKLTNLLPVHPKQHERIHGPEWLNKGCHREVTVDIGARPGSNTGKEVAQPYVSSAIMETAAPEGSPDSG